MNKVYKVFGVIGFLLFSLSVLSNVHAALLSPGGSSQGGGILIPQLLQFTSDGTGVLPSNGLNLGNSSQPIPSLFATSATTTNLFSTTASSTSLFASTLSVRGSALTVTSNGNVGIGTSTPASIFHVENVPPGNGVIATTTVEFGGSTSTARTCFNVNNSAGATISFYFVGTTLTVENNRCR